MILRHYMIHQIAITTCLMLLFLMVLLLGGRLIRYFGIAAEGGLDTDVLLTLIGYNLPYFLELILPLSFFIGLMLVFGRMYSDHEMAVLNGGGISRGRLSLYILPLIVLIFVVQVWITLIGKPWGVAKATNIWQEQSVMDIFDLIRPRHFVSSGDYHVYVGEVGKNKDYLNDVIVISMNGKGNLIDTSGETPTQPDFNPPPKGQIGEKDSIIFAKSATQVHSTDGVVRLDLYEGRRYEVNTSTQEYSQVGFGRYRISLMDKSQNTPQDMKIEGIPTVELWQMIIGNKPHPNPNEVKAEMGYRLSLPWLLIIAVMLATPLATVRPRQGRWLKLIPAIFIFVANVLTLISLKETISKGKVGVWIYPVATGLMMAFALYLNYHERLMTKLRLSKGA